MHLAPQLHVPFLTHSWHACTLRGDFLPLDLGRGVDGRVPAAARFCLRFLRPLPLPLPDPRDPFEPREPLEPPERPERLEPPLPERREPWDFREPLELRELLREPCEPCDPVERGRRDLPLLPRRGVAAAVRDALRPALGGRLGRSWMRCAQFLSRGQQPEMKYFLQRPSGMAGHLPLRVAGAADWSRRSLP